MATATGTCVLCNLTVTEQEYRREIDCPSQSCPGRVYHEDCIAAYLKRTKYSKDRCTGFPCPAILSNGKPCPGYVCKMHTFFPSNPKKKQARLEAAVANAALAKARPAAAAPKPKAGAQVAIAAMKRAAPEGAAQQPVAVKAAKPLSGITNTGNNNIRPVNIDKLKPANQEQRIIPGLSGPIQNLSTREALRAEVAKLRAEAKNPTANSSNNNVNNSAARVITGAWLQSRVGVGVGGNAKSDKGNDEEPERTPHAATLWDAFAKAPGLGKDLNYFQLAHTTRNSGGKFSARLRKRLDGESSATTFPSNDGTSSDCDSIGSPSTARDMEEFDVHSGFESRAGSLAISGDDFPALTPTKASATMRTDPLSALQGACVGPQTETAGNLALLPASTADSDPVVEYDMVYGNEDGSYLVLDAVSNMYYLLTDVYGDSAELIECMAEDGNLYTCVAVRRSQLEMRTELQRAWIQAQVDVQPAQVATEADFGVAAVAAGAPVMPAEYVYGCGEAGACTAAAAAVEERGVGYEAAEDTDVESLMQLLCV
ncbi:hypothetical protein Agub_g11280 [Astrephomene gubernaculifera]|uniref:Uncharacterized protein n=1 Tax=Astrephomene gubernaculifera TaxID=47775 RepID=A0AAD3DXZ3_9CHLO|nr:hypothetical protein Agub_g11280 [Astrephomene gubernaculifera]